MGMLVISRKAGESFHITDKIRVRVLSIEGGCARVGIEAPREMEILREELAEQLGSSPNSAALSETPAPGVKA